MTPTLLLLQGAALAASLLHVLIDVWLGLFGRGDPMTIGEGLTLVSFAVLYGWWPSAAAAATAGIRGALLAIAILTGVWAFVGNGVLGLAFCAPPCASASPWQDVSHIGSAVFGGWAAVAAWRAYRSMSGATQIAPPVTAVFLIVLSYAAQATSFTLPQ